jgi:hypothetical protein
VVGVGKRESAKVSHAGAASSARRPSSAAQEESAKRAEELRDEFNALYNDHPEATFDEMGEESTVAFDAAFAQ